MMPPRPAAPRPPGWPWRLGQLAQGLVMGMLLVAAVIGLLALIGGVSIFVYQGY